MRILGFRNIIDKDIEKYRTQNGALRDSNTTLEVARSACHQNSDRRFLKHLNFGQILEGT